MECFSIKLLSEKVRGGVKKKKKGAKAAIRETDRECKEANAEKMWLIIVPGLSRRININTRAQCI